MMPDLLDDPTRLDDNRETGKVARILTNGGLDRVVAETPAETIEEAIERVQYEMNELYPEAEFTVTYEDFPDGK